MVPAGVIGGIGMFPLYNEDTAAAAVKIRPKTIAPPAMIFGLMTVLALRDGVLRSSIERVRAVTALLFGGLLASGLPRLLWLQDARAIRTILS